MMAPRRRSSARSTRRPPGSGPTPTVTAGSWRPSSLATRRWVETLLAPLALPSHPAVLARFSARAALPARLVAERSVPRRTGAGALRRAGGHSMLPLTRMPSAAFGPILGVHPAHAVGWPFPRGGSQRLADGLASYLESLGGEIETGHRVLSLAEVAGESSVLLGGTPRQLLSPGRRGAPRAVPACAGTLPVRARSLQDRLGTRRADPLAGARVRTRGDRASRRNTRRDCRLRAGAVGRRRRQATFICSRSRACSIRRGHRRKAHGVVTLPCTERIRR